MRRLIQKQMLMTHLSNRRVRTVGERINQFGVGLSRMARTIRERMNTR